MEKSYTKYVIMTKDETRWLRSTSKYLALAGVSVKDNRYTPQQWDLVEEARFALCCYISNKKKLKFDDFKIVKLEFKYSSISEEPALPTSHLFYLSSWGLQPEDITDDHVVQILQHSFKTKVKSFTYNLKLETDRTGYTSHIVCVSDIEWEV